MTCRAARAGTSSPAGWTSSVTTARRDEFSSGLIYENESGALNEAFSDMMGTSIEFFYRPTGTGSMQADY